MVSALESSCGSYDCSDVEIHVIECILLTDARDGRGDSGNEEEVVYG